MDPRFSLAGEDVGTKTGTERIVRVRDEAAGLSMAVAPARGGEVASLSVRYRGRWFEMLHRALDFAETAEWDGRAPLLFPQVGQGYAPSVRPPAPVSPDSPCSWELGGRVYPMPAHGFARRLPWELAAGPDGASPAVRCALRSSAETRRMYPFDFSLEARHELADNAVVSRYLLAAGDNDRPMPFTMGNHLSLRAPFTDAGGYREVRVVTPCRFEHELSEDNLLSGRRRPLDLAGGATLADERLSNIVLGGYAAGEGWVRVEDPNSFSVRVSQRQATPRFRQEDVFFVFWGEERLRYWCPEPWLGGPDALSTGRRVAFLPPGESFRWEVTVEVLR